MGGEPNTQMILRTANPASLPPQHRHYYEAPPPLEMAKRQPWRTLAPVVKAPYVLCEALAPWTIIFDLDTFDMSDQALVQVHLEICGPNDGQVRWVLHEEHQISLMSMDGIAYLGVNGTIVNKSRIVAISAQEGPWVARLTYRQTLGFDKMVRYMKV